MKRVIRIFPTVALVVLAACPDEKPIDLSNKKSPTRSAPAVARVEKPAHPPMPDGVPSFELPLSRSASPLLYAPELVAFSDKILRKKTTLVPAEMFTGTLVDYPLSINIGDLFATARLDEGPGDVALYVRSSASAFSTLDVLGDLRDKRVALAVNRVGATGQLAYLFGPGDTTVRERIELDVTNDDVTIGEDMFSAQRAGAVGDGIMEAVKARRAQSALGVEARVAIQIGTTNQRLVEVLEWLGHAGVESIRLSVNFDITTRAAASRGGSVPTVRIGQPNTQGDLDKAIIRRYIKRNIQKITYCYEKELLFEPGLAGTVSTQFFITPLGNVASAAASGVSPKVASCIADVIRGIQFPKPKGGGGVQVNYPFMLRTDG